MDGQRDRPRRAATAVAGAPCSYGAFEVTVGIEPHVPDALQVLEAVRAAGFAGIDLGPAGYLGDAAHLADRLRTRDLSLAGGYVALPFSEPSQLPRAMHDLDDVLDLFDAASANDHAPFAPRPTLADAGSNLRRSSPGRSHTDQKLGLSPDGWNRLAEGVRRAVDVCRERGYEPTFHHHAGTFVEAPEEIQTLLDRTDVGLCLDTGHMLLGGGDPVQAVRDWGPRINHVHLKDARMSVIQRLIEDRAPMIEVWRRYAFSALGQGDLDVNGVLQGLTASAYAGWLVVEQDRFPDPAGPADAALDQERNREFLRARGI